MRFFSICKEVFPRLFCHAGDLCCRRQVNSRSSPVIKIYFSSIVLHVITTISLNSGYEDRETEVPCGKK